MQANAGFQKSMTLEAGGYSLGTSAVLGYNNGQFGVEKGLSHVELTAYSAISAGALEIAPSVTFVGIFEDTVNPEDNEFFSL